MAIPSSILLGEPHRQRTLVGYSPWGRKRVGHDLATKQQQYLHYSKCCNCHNIYMFVWLFSYFLRINSQEQSIQVKWCIFKHLFYTVKSSSRKDIPILYILTSGVGAFLFPCNLTVCGYYELFKSLPTCQAKIGICVYLAFAFLLL